MLLRVSTVGPEAGSADTSPDVHGWAMKLYTDEGNQDWVFNNTVRTIIVGMGMITANASEAGILHSGSYQVSFYESLSQETPPDPPT